MCFPQEAGCEEPVEEAVPCSAQQLCPEQGGQTVPSWVWSCPGLGTAACLASLPPVHPLRAQFSMELLHFTLTGAKGGITSSDSSALGELCSIRAASSVI